MSTPLRVVAVVDAPGAAVEQAATIVAPPVHTRIVETPAGVLLTLERPAAGWRRGAVLRELQGLLAQVLGRLPDDGPA